MATKNFDIPNARVAREMTDSELADALDGLRGEAFNLRFMRAAGKLETPARLRLTRKSVARALTERAQRLAAAGGQA